MNRSEPKRPLSRPTGYYARPAGTTVQVRQGDGAYPLPAGLAPGDSVKILSFDTGNYSVEREGRTFCVFMTNIVELPPDQNKKSSASANRTGQSNHPPVG